MKKIIKIISVLIVAIIISAIVYVKTNSNNDTVKMQNKEALATKAPSIWIGRPCAHISLQLCVWHLPTGGTLADIGIFYY